MAEAECKLPARQQKAESVPTVSVNGEERVPSPLPAEQPQDAPPLSVDAGQPPSPNEKEKHLIKNSTTIQSNKSRACKKKKKCLSDIFGHIVGGLKDSSTITETLEQLHSPNRLLKKDPEDSPYADLDTVPMLHRPKRVAMSPVQDKDRPVRRERAATKVKTVFTEKVKHSTDLPDSSGIVTKKLTTNLKNSDGSCQELSYSSTKNHSVNLPASSRLMTRALEAGEDMDLKDALATSQISTNAHSDCHNNKPTNAALITSEMSPSWNSSANISSSANHSSPKRRARKPDKKHIRNGSLIQSRGAGLRESPEQAVRIKTENVVDDLSSSSSPSSSLSPMDAFQDVKELMFKSLVKEESSDSELTVFRPDSNYKFSTFLMLLKDMHDTREKEGKPLALPPSPVLIKEEPLVIPTSTGGHLLKASSDLYGQGIKTEIGQSEKSRKSQITALKNKNRTKAIMTADTYHCKDFPVQTKIGSTDKQRRKQRLPAKLKLSISGLSSELADLAYGREFVTGHADLADRGSGCPSASYLDKNSESTMAPKKRWQMVEGGVAEDVSEVSAEINGAYTSRASLDLDLDFEKHAENDFHFSDTGSTAGKPQTLVKFLHRDC